MKHLVSLFALTAIASAATAQTSTTEWVPIPVDAAASGTTTKALCTAAAKKKPSQSVTCVERVKTSAAPSPAPVPAPPAPAPAPVPNPFPVGEVRVTQCVAPLTGWQTEVRDYTLTNGVWAPSAYRVTVACGAAPAPAPAPVPAPPAPAPAPTPAPAPSPVGQPAACSGSAGMMPAIDCSKIPAPVAGFKTARVRPIGGDQPPNPNQDIGAVREMCGFTKMGFFDPLVYPGQPNASHLHVYYGNDAINENTTSASILTGGSTCAGGTLNRTAYWAPALIDTSSGTPLLPERSPTEIGNDQYFNGNISLFYYKTGYFGVNPADVKPVPAGLHLIGGNSKSAVAQGNVKYGCGGFNWQSTIPDCGAGTYMWMSVEMPQCWDGVNLDSPDHQSHMAFANGGCKDPAFPVALPVISFELKYKMTKSYGKNVLALASDNYDWKSKGGGLSGHIDYFFAWDAATIKTFTSNCLNKSMDCHANLLGNGQTLY